MPPQPIADLLAAKEVELSAKLAQGRARLRHSGNRGDAAEIALREFLFDHLPRRFDVGQGEVIDQNGYRTGQMDVVISTQDQPFHEPPSEPSLYIVEGVHALGEVKACLTTREVADILEKGRSVARLRIGHIRGSTVFASHSDRARWVDGHPPFFGSPGIDVDTVRTGLSA